MNLWKLYNKTYDDQTLIVVRPLYSYKYLVKMCNKKNVKIINFHSPDQYVKVNGDSLIPEHMV